MSIVLSQVVCGPLLQQPQETNTGRHLLHATDTAAWSKVRDAWSPGRRRRTHMLKRDPDRGVGLAEPPWEGLSHRNGVVRKRSPGDTRHPNIRTVQGKLQYLRIYLKCRPMLGTGKRQWVERTQALASAGPAL